MNSKVVQIDKSIYCKVILLFEDSTPHIPQIGTTMRNIAIQWKSVNAAFLNKC